jgi:hypothetical protein
MISERHQASCRHEGSKSLQKQYSYVEICEADKYSNVSDYKLITCAGNYNWK